MGKVKMLIVIVAAMALTLGLAGMASAAAISCGDCHSAPPADGDNCANTARGLHGTHYNYSSATFKKTVASYGKCAYCHTQTTGTAPTTTHNNNYMNVTGNTVGGINTAGLDYNTTAKTCASACHKNSEAAAPKWGNYTATTVGGIKLDCNSCHDDSGSAAGLSNAHAVHLGTAIPTGTALDGSANAKCAACHPNNVNDLWSGGKADDGTKKAYPHASDGTNVVSANATVANAGWNGTSCTTACHTNSTADAWSAASLTCGSCHDDAGTSLGGAHSIHIAAGKTCSNCHTVPGAGDTSHASALPLAADNATITLAAGSFTDGANTCSNTGAGCHGNPSSSPDWYGPYGNGCSTCHKYPGATSDWVANNGHAVRYASGVAVNTHLRDNATYNKTSDTVDAVCADVNKCGRCHSGVTAASGHNNGAITLSASGSADCGGGNFTFGVATTGTRVTCTNVACHSGKKTPNWW